MTDLLTRLEELEKAATPEPWGHRQTVEGDFCLVIKDNEENPVNVKTMFMRDAELIAEFRNALPALLRVARLGERLVEASKSMDAGMFVPELVIEFSEALSDLEALSDQSGGEG